MNEETTPAERGLALEQRIERLFRARGYHVVHDAWLTGRSGTKHQIDVVATHQAPLHTAQIIVEAKAYQGSVDKDRVMKLIHIVNDLGSDRGIIVTTSVFTPDALNTARGYNIDLWDRDRLSKEIGEAEIDSVGRGNTPSANVVNHMIRPTIDGDELRTRMEQQVAKRARGTLGIGKILETLVSFRAMTYPLYDADLAVEVDEVQRVGLLRKEQVTRTAVATVTFDAHAGVPVEPSEDGISFEHGWMTGLSADEIAILRSAESKFALQDVTALGLTDTRAKRSLASLVANGCIQRLGTRPETYVCLQTIPSIPVDLRAISSVHIVESDMESGFEPFRTSIVEPGALIRTITTWWPRASVRALRLVRYPYFCAVYQRPDGSHRAEAIDGVTGVPCDVVGRLIEVGD